jgi:hypothetical protein
MGGVITCTLIFRITVAMGFRDPQVVNEISVLEA